MQSGKAIVSAEISAVLIKADGSKVDLGTLAYWHRNPLKRLLFALKKLAIKRSV
jgi:hypothetical protein